MQRGFDKKWRICLHDSGYVQGLMRTLGIPATLAQLLYVRKINAKEAKRFLDSPLTALNPPENLFGCIKAAKLIAEGIRARESFIIYGDYDLDGMSAAAVLYRCISALGGKVSYYIPDRIDDGYGLHDHTVDKLAQRGANWLITVDCGIHSRDEIAKANALGMKTIVTDHHPPAENGELPPALAIVHPGIEVNGQSMPELSGSAVAFKLAWALCVEYQGAARLDERLRGILLEQLATATLGIVADVVPLTRDNRILTANGLRYLQACPSVGILELLRSLNLHQRPLQAESIAFKIAPMLNAAGRVGDPNDAVELLTTFQPSRAQKLVSRLRDWNVKRKELETIIFHQAQEQVEQNFKSEEEYPVLVLARREWHEGVIGVVANRIVEIYNRPTVLIAIPEKDNMPGNKKEAAQKWAHRQSKESPESPTVELSLEIPDDSSDRSSVGASDGASENILSDEAAGQESTADGDILCSGSSRSIAGFNIKDALAFCSDILVRSGGHPMAAGLMVAQDRIEEFRQKINQYARDSFNKVEHEEPRLIDAETPLSSISIKTLSALEQLAPFGRSNPLPVLAATGVRLNSLPQRTSDGAHARFDFYQDGCIVPGVAFQHGDWADQMGSAASQTFDIVFEAVINEYAGKRSVQIRLLDWRTPSSRETI